jgi:membrane associated rhomboid family serine protease
VRVYNLVFLGFYVTSIALPAWVMLGYWALLQLLGGATSVASEGGGVAYAAHVGGFAAGALLVRLFARPDFVAQHKAHQWRPRNLGWDRGRWP